MKKTLKKCLSVLLAIAVVLGSAFAGLNGAVLSSGFSVKTNAANEAFNEAMYIVQESVTCDGKITYVVYLKGGLKVSGANVYVEFDNKALTIYDGGAYTKVDEFGDSIPMVPGIYEYGFLLNSTNICSVGYVNISPSLLTKDMPFLKITFKINGGYDVADIKFTCVEFFCENEGLNITKADKPIVMFDENVDVTKAEHISGDWVQQEATVYSAGYKYRECIVCEQVIESVVLPQLLCEEPGLLGVFPDKIGLIFDWDSVKGADSYAVYRRTQSSGWEFLTEVAYNTTTYLDSSVEDGVLYYYSVSAINEAGESTYDTVGVSGKYHTHKFSEWVITVPSTCTTSGEKIRKCNCGEEEKVTIEPDGHKCLDEWVIDVSPTCTENGSKSHICTVCGEKTDVTTIIATGHNYEIISYITEHPHTTSYKCSGCGDEKTEDTVDPDCVECVLGSNLPIKGNENTVVDYDNFKIFTNVKNSDDITEILISSESAGVIAEASHVYGNCELYGTGSVVVVFDNDYIADFTLIVNGDLNGDSACDVLDAAAAHLYSVGLDVPTENEILAANGCISDEINANSYQNIVNMMLAG